ncbi:transposase [Paracandidimonas lactea]|uniref:transposase n=1 Tax=Paracandidimonas lactea TaxID=2895524 RepID=UPI0034E29B89
MTVLGKSNADSDHNLPRWRFTRELKRKVVEQLLDSGLIGAKVAREHTLHPNQLCPLAQRVSPHGSSAARSG